MSTNHVDQHNAVLASLPLGRSNESFYWLMTFASSNGNVTLPTLNNHQRLLGYLESTTQRHHVADATFDKTIRIAALATIVLFGVTGCLLVCAWLWCHRRRTSHVNALIWHLTISDLLVVSCACLPQLLWEFDRRWSLGVVACKSLKFMQSFVIMSSNYMLVALALDRHQAIRSPLREPSTACKLTLPGWIAAGVLSIPQLFIFHVNHVPANASTMFANMTVCESIFRLTPMWTRQAYLTYVGVAVFYVPFALIAIAYVRIFLKIARRANEQDIVKTTPANRKSFASNSRQGSLKQRFRGASFKLNGGAAAAVGNGSAYGGSEAKKMTLSSNGAGGGGGGGGQELQRVSIQSTRVTSFARAKTKTLKMTVVILGAFVVCGLPYHVLEMIYSYGDHSTVPSWLAAVLGSMAVANSAVNPYVFLAFSINARFCCSTFRRWLPCPGRCRGESSSMKLRRAEQGLAGQGTGHNYGGGASLSDPGTTMVRRSPAITCNSFVQSGADCQQRHVTQSLQPAGRSAEDVTMTDSGVEMIQLQLTGVSISTLEQQQQDQLALLQQQLEHNSLNTE